MSDFLKNFKNIDKMTSLVNTPSLKAMQRLQFNLPEFEPMGALQSSMINLHGFESMEAFQSSLFDSSRLEAIAELQSSLFDSSGLGSIAGLQSSLFDSFGLGSIAELQSSLFNNFGMESIEGLQPSLFDSSGLEAIAELQSSLFDSFGLASMTGLQSSMLNSDELMNMAELKSNITDMAAFTLKSVGGLQSPIFNTGVLTSIGDGVLNASAIDAMQLAMPSINSAALSTLKSFQIGSGEYDEERKLGGNLLDEVVEALDTSKEFQLLSDNSKAFLLYVYHKYIFHLLLNIIAGIIVVLNQGAILEIQEKLHAVDSPVDVKKLKKSQLITSNSELLKGYRLTATGLNLREEPNRQSDVIIVLPIYTLINVIDKSKRSWLYVQLEIEDELIEGWVARKHTIYFK